MAFQSDIQSQVNKSKASVTRSVNQAKARVSKFKSRLENPIGGSSATGTTRLVFPEALAGKMDNENFPCVQVKAVYPHNKNRTDTIPGIYLPMPVGFSTADGASYSTIELGFFGGPTPAEGEEREMKDADKKIFGNKLAGDIASFTGADQLTGVIKRDQRDLGVALNPDASLVLDGTTLRSFNLAFKLVSESENESNIALAIEDHFRKYLYPEKGGNIALKYPPIFNIKFLLGGEDNRFLPTVKESYLTQVTAVHNPTGNGYHANGAPVEIDLSLTFAETKALTREDLYPKG